MMSGGDNFSSIEPDGLRRRQTLRDLPAPSPPQVHTFLQIREANALYVLIQTAGPPSTADWAFWIVDRRCAITNVVRPFIK